MWMSHAAFQGRRTPSSTPHSTRFNVQSRFGVMDEAPKLVERVEIDVAEAPTVTPSVIVSTLPGESPRSQVESKRSCELSLVASETTESDFVLSSGCLRREIHLGG